MVDNINFEAPKTKDFVNFAKNIKVDGKKTLVVLPEVNKMYICLLATSRALRS